MGLRDDQVANVDPDLLGRFIAALKAVAAEIVEEPIETPDHALRIALAKRVMLERQADNYGRVILELAVARAPKLRAARDLLADEDITGVVTFYVEILAREGW